MGGKKRNAGTLANAGRYTPEMLRAVRSAAARENLKSVTIELAQQAQRLTKKDVAAWRAAWQMALAVDNPQRSRLYDVYTDTLVDLHLTGCIGQRTGFVAKKAFRLTGKAGKENRELTELLEAEWFKDFMGLVLESRYWGHSLIQFGDVQRPPAGNMRFAGVELVPRRHVVPEFGVIVRSVGDEPKRGYSYREGALAGWCIEAGKPHDLGLLLKCSPEAISKRHMLGFWDSFGELFGMPIRIGKTTSRDDREISKVEHMLAEMGSAAWGLFPEGTEIEIKETTRGDAFNVYDKRIDRANSEMSKGILNQTMTIDNGSSLSQSEVHLDVLKNVIEADADFVRDVVNNRLLPFMVSHGFPLSGYRFEWDDAVEYTPDQMVNIEQMLLTAGYEIEQAYFTDRYNIPITGRTAPATVPMGGLAAPEPQLKLSREDLDFFA